MTYRLDDLIRLMACLRDPIHGCPWDREQTYNSIVPFTLEEAYEVADVIERGALRRTLFRARRFAFPDSFLCATG